MAEQQRRVVDNIVDAFYNEHKASADEFFIAMSRLEDDMTRPKAMTYFDEAKARALGAAPPPIPPPPGPGHSGGPAALPPMLRYGGRQMTTDVFAPGQKSAAAAIRGVRATATSKVKQDLPVNVDVQVLFDVSAMQSIRDALKDVLGVPRKTQVHPSALQRVHVMKLKQNVLLCDINGPDATVASLIYEALMNIGFIAEMAMINDEPSIVITDVCSDARVRIRNIFQDARDASDVKTSPGLAYHLFALNDSNWLCQEYFKYANITVTGVPVIQEPLP